ncbi:SocA family protein [Facklamia sp. DSM 111018]|uniref:SocA family protein n=1 Tax=Facklamia lactis TaxID=2749967 RepID=A0ABS0LSI8_9LACT|nr:type II toxin-antitoxin system antitoxin SocA domain-containing protein [Facklamia lactis]MBG9986224.1 SocA family protein [Facklamia lactis]
MEAVDVAKWFLSKESMSPKKIQKLVYYAYSWYLTLMNETVEGINNRLFDEKIKAWVHGPVIYSIYNEYREYGYHNVPKQDTDENLYTEDMLDVFQQVWDVYGDYSANELESITHQEEPWREARGELKPLDNGYDSIKDETIFSYYLEQMEDE